MQQVAADSIEPAAERHSCTVCPLLCDDLAIAADGVERACPHGREAILAAVAAADASQPEASDDGRPTTREQGIRLAAAALSDARRVLVTGLAAGTLEAIAAACDVAELLGAAVDANLADSARSAGPTIARVGEVTAAWEELRDRADLVIFWCCDPVASHPRFLERFVGPELPDGRPRRTIAVGHDAVMPDGSLHRHLLLPDADAVEAARCLQLRCVGQSGPAALAAPLAAVCDTVHEAIRMATCVAIVTNDADDDIGLEAWKIGRAHV